MLTLSVQCKTFALLLLIMVLTSSVASAASSRPASQESVQAAEPAGFEFLGRIWIYLQNLGRKAGCDIDPDGRCRVQIIQSTPAEAGCDIAPNGRCRT